MRTTMRQMMGVFAQFDRGMFVAKLHRGRRTEGNKGEYTYGGPAPQEPVTRTPHY
ncbi:hypothetical protein ACIOC1_34685 [Streptomyces sp. NPDC088197]|uniref:hypothetical protein n=1 Tax=unclassified Streptomyces TaxID=2593676 RepID=UPI0036E67CE5